MKVLLAGIISIILCSGTAFAYPFITCDEQPGVEYYMLYIDESEIRTPAPLHYDLATVAKGAHVE